MNSSVIIGADGGGTKTNFMAIDTATGKLLAESTAEGSNRYALGMEETVRRLMAGIRALKLPPSLPIAAFSFGDPAMDDSDPADGEELRQRLSQALSAPVFSKSDVFMALFALTQGSPGALLIAGTGSMGVALTQAWDPAHPLAPLTVGGWGYPSTDSGSGYSIAVKGITAAFDAFDRVAPATALCQEVLEEFGCSHPRRLIDRFNSQSLSKSQIAAFARRVDACAQQGDETAKAILSDAACRLSAYAIAMLKELPENQRHLGLFGSVLLNNRSIRQSLREQVLKHYPDARIEIPAMPPQWGAAQYALQAIGGKP